MLVGLSYFKLALEKLGPIEGLWEYPWVAAVLLELPLRLGATTDPAYVRTWLAAMLALDAAFAYALWRAAGRRPSHGLYLWMFSFPALGPLMLASFDLAPAVISATALLALGAARGAVAGGGLVSAAAAIKLWPAAALPALLVPGDSRQRKRLLVAALVAGLVVVAVTWAAAGWLRLISPLLWHEGRGLQVEAFAALPFLWARFFDGGARWTTPATRFNCYEVSGPGVELALDIAAAAMLAGACALAFLHLRAWRAPAAARTPSLAAGLFLTSVLVFVFTNKVFSPQYLVWLAAPLAALGAMGSLRRADAALFLLACLCTQVVFPLSYAPLLKGAAAPLLALTLRDLLLVVLGVRLALQVWRA